MALGLNARKYPRLPVDFEVTWAIESLGLSGKGTMVDVSALGASFRIDRQLPLTGAVVFTLTAPQVPSLPKQTRLRWFRKLSVWPPSFLCGVVFQGAIGPDWSDWIHERAQALGREGAQGTTGR